MVATITGCGIATPPPSARMPLPSEPTMINYVDPALVEGLSTRTLNGQNSESRYTHAVYPAIADAPRLTQRLHETVTERLDHFNRDKTSAFTLARPEFNVDWQLTAASSEVLGVRLRVGRSAGIGWHESRTTLWYDRTTRHVLDSFGLLKDRPALTTLAGLVRDELVLRGPLVNPNALRPEPEMFDSLGFNPRGDLVVEFDDRQVGRRAAGRVAVAVPSATAAPLLSETGLRARRAAVGNVGVPGPASPQDIAAASTDKPAARSSRAGDVNCAEIKCVALTYDDGPGPETARLLDVLGSYGARATFFSLGSNAATRPDLLRRMRDEGHLVANHTWSHRDLDTLSPAKIADQLIRTQHTVAQAIGQIPTLMRPPYEGTGSRAASVAARLGMAVVHWDVDAEDRGDPDPRAIADRVVAGAGSGAIVLMHDFHGPTVDAAPEILRRLTEAGYMLVTVPELYGSHEMEPGRTYDSGVAPVTPEKRSMP